MSSLLSNQSFVGDGPAIPINPNAPSSVSVKTALMEDAVAADVLDIQSTKKNQIALFTNPYKGEHEEALVVTTTGVLTYLQRSPASPTGWLQTPVEGAPARVSEVVTLIHTYAEEVWAACVDDDTKALVFFELDPSSTWSKKPDQVLNITGRWTQLYVHYTPEVPSRATVFGLDPNGMTVNLATAFSVSNPPRWRMAGSISLPTAVDEYAAGFSTRGQFHTNYVIYGRKGDIVTCFVYDIYQSKVTAVEEVAKEVDALVGVYDCGLGGLSIALLSKTDVVFATRGYTPPIFGARRLSGLDFRTAALWQDQERRVHLYGITRSNRLQVVRQSGWSSGSGSFYFPVFAEAKDEQGSSVLAVVGLHDQVAAIHVDSYPDERPKQFLHLDGEAPAAAYRIATQDATTSAWTEEKVRLPSGGIPHKVRRYACEASLLNFYKTPIANYDVAITASETVEIFDGDVSHVAGPRTAVTLKTNAMGRLSFSLAADSLTPPVIQLNAVGLEKGAVIRPAAALHAYLSGEGTLPRLQTVLDEQSLKDATAGGGPLVTHWTITPGQAITTFKDSFSAAAGKEPPTRMVAGYGAPQKVRAILIQTYDPTRPSYQEIVTDEEHAQYSVIHRTHPSYGGLWEDFLEWGADVWQGIKRAAVTVAGVLVDLAERTAKILIKIGDSIVELGRFILKSLEDAANVVQAVFQQVGAAVSRVVEWLTTPFSFDDTWDTKCAFEKLLTQSPRVVTEVADHFAGIVDGWFEQQEQKVRESFGALKAQYAGNLAPALQAAGGGLPTASGVPVRKDALESPHANWLLARVSSAPQSVMAEVADALRVQAGDFWDDFMAAWNKNGTGPAFVESAKAFAAIFSELVDFNNPRPLGQRELDRILTFIEDSLVALLKLCDSVFHAGLSLAKGGAALLKTLLAVKLDSLPLIGKIYTWFQSCLKNPPKDPEELTVGALASLLLAFPVTSIYKLINGPKEAPFPGGKLYPKDHAEQLGISGGATGYLAVTFLAQMFYGLCEFASDMQQASESPSAPTFFDYATTIVSCALTVLSIPFFGIDKDGNMSITIEPGVGYGLVWGNWLMCAVVSGANVVMMVKSKHLVRNWRFGEVNLGAAIQCVLGLCNFAMYGAMVHFNPNLSLGVKVGSGLLLAPNALQFMRILPIDPYLPPSEQVWRKAAHLVKAGGDLVFDIGGAIAYLIGSLEAPATEPLLAAAE